MILHPSEYQSYQDNMRVGYDGVYLILKQGLGSDKFSSSKTSAHNPVI